MYYDRAGNPLPDGTLQWARAFERDDRRVAETTVGRYWVSTVFLGLDHNFDPHGPPLIFETMIFDRADTDGLSTGVERECWRYPTEAAALAGHDQAVEVVKRWPQRRRGWRRRVDDRILATKPTTIIRINEAAFVWSVGFGGWALLAHLSVAPWVVPIHACNAVFSAWNARRLRRSLNANDSR